MDKSIEKAICSNVAENVIKSLILDDKQKIIDLSYMYSGECEVVIRGSLNILELDKYTAIKSYIKVLCDLHYVESCFTDVQDVYDSVFMVALKKIALDISVDIDIKIRCLIGGIKNA